MVEGPTRPERITKHFGPAPLVSIVLPLVSKFFIDLANVLLVGVFSALWLVKAMVLMSCGSNSLVRLALRPADMQLGLLTEWAPPQFRKQPTLARFCERSVLQPRVGTKDKVG